jgi:xanthine dehydrogenase YagR molybdenum-binding subunit
MTVPNIGAPLDRVDGRLKVTGAAKYSAEWPMPGVAHGFLVLSTIAGGRIASIDVTRAQRAAGVIAVMTYLNAPRVDTAANAKGASKAPMLLQNATIAYDRQPVAVVLADTFERAQDAASLVEVHYERLRPQTVFADGTPYKPSAVHGKDADTLRGDAAAALAGAAISVDNVYRTPPEHHNPMEPHATMARWDGDMLTVYDASQGVFQARAQLATLFGVPPANVRVIAKFIGGGFGSKGSTWPHTILAAMAAKLIGRAVKLALWRPQMWGSVGYRSPTIQRVALGANRDGTLVSTIHEVQSQTSQIDEFVEPSGLLTTMLYTSPALRVTHRLTKLNVGTPTYMRAPGESSGSFALESAMDELAYATQLDPIELRLRNYAETDQDAKLPYSSKSLRECYRAGAEAFDWKRRTAAPRSMRDGRMLVGLGVATATYPTNRSAASAVARIDALGNAVVQSGGVDIGTGAYTAFSQVAAEALGIPVERVAFGLGDTRMPNAPNAGGSQLTASVGSAVKLAALDARNKVAQLAIADPHSPLNGATLDALDAKDGRLSLKADPTRGETYAAIIARSGLSVVEGTADAKPGVEKTEYSMHAFGAQFAEVRVDPDLGTIRVVRQLGAFAAGRILNAKLARSQYIGGMTMGLGMALFEETRRDDRTGRVMNANLAEYLVPVHADVPGTEALLIEEVDPHVNEIGTKGIGEIGIVGAAAAIANAVFHATGKRIRDLPLTPDKLLV